MTRPARLFILGILPALAVSLLGSGTAVAKHHDGRILLTGRDGIDLLDPASGQAHLVTKNGTGPAFLPGRRSFAYVRAGGFAHGGRYTEYSVFIKSLRDRDPRARGRRLFGWKRFFVRAIDVSRAGRLVFSAKPGPGPDPSGDVLDIYSSDLHGRHVRRLTRSPAFENDPVISPDGRRVAYTRRVEGRGQIFVMNIDGTHQRRLTHDGRRERLPFWAPSGRELVFISQPSGHSANYRDVRTVTLGAKERFLTRFADGQVSNPVYSPDGGSIAYLHGEAAWLMNARGAGKHLLHRAGGEFGGYEGGVDWGR